MANRLLLEAGTDGYLLEDGSGVLLDEESSNFLEIVNHANTTVAYQGAGTYRVEKTASGGSYSASAVSSASIAGDFVLRMDPATANGLFAGLNDNPTAGNDPGDINHCWVFGGGDWQVRTPAGTFITNFVVGATYAWLWRSGSMIYWGRGADLATAQASPDHSVTDSSTLYFDCALFDVGNSLDVKFYEVIAAQTLAPSLFTNTQTFHAATITATYNLAPSLYTNPQTFYGQTIAPGAVSLAPSLLTNSQTFHAATITATYNLAPSLFTNAQTFHSATVSPGAVSLSPSLLSNSQTFYAQTVTATYTIEAPLLSNSQTFYASTVDQIVAAQSLSPALFTNAQSFFAQTIAPGAVTLEPGLLTNSNTIYAPTLTATYTISVPLLTNRQKFWRSLLGAEPEYELQTPLGWRYPDPASSAWGGNAQSGGGAWVRADTPSQRLSGGSGGSGGAAWSRATKNTTNW